MAKGRKSKPLVEKLEADKAVVVEQLIGDIYQNPIVLQQEQETKRKTWRSLSKFQYPSDELRSDLDKRIPGHLIVQLHRTFLDSGYTDFTGLITTGKLTPQPAGNTNFSAFELLCHLPRYTGALQSAIKLLWSENPDRIAFQEALNTDLTYLGSSWAALACGPFTESGQLAYQFIYDPEGLRISIKPRDDDSTDPSMYPEKVGNTSELLTFVNALLQTAIRVVDVTTIGRSYRLSKLMLAAMDGTLNLDSIRVNVKDPEEWDYVNPAADSELQAHKHEKPGS